MRLDAIDNFLFVLISILIFLTIIVIGFGIGVFLDENCARFRKIFAIVVPILIFLTLSSGVAKVFTPTTKEMIAIKVLPIVVNSNLVQKTIPRESEELYTLAKDYLKTKIGTNK
jgi:hypothetical protein